MLYVGNMGSASPIPWGAMRKAIHEVFLFMVWEGERATLYDFSCGSPAEGLLRSPRMDDIPDMIRLR